MNLGLMMRHDPARMRFARSLGAETAALVLQAGEPWLPGGKRVDVDWRPKGAALIGEFQEAGLRVSCLSLYPNVLDADERRAAKSAEPAS